MKDKGIQKICQHERITGTTIANGKSTITCDYCGKDLTKDELEQKEE